MINFTRAFDLAWERMHVILFRPWDPAKWFVIGFNVFLVMLLYGEASINRPVSFTAQPTGFTYEYHSLPAFLHAAKGWASTAGGLLSGSWSIFFIIFAILSVVVVLVGFWLGSRGQFMLLDNIVRNRGAISAPWQRYAWQGNSWFLFQLGLTFVYYLLIAISGGALIALNWSWIMAERNPDSSETALLGLSILVLGLLWLAYGAAIILMRTFVVPLYFKQTISLGGALLVVARLTVTHTLSILCYVLINIGLYFAGVIVAIAISCVMCCVICWLALIPFLGSILASFIFSQIYAPIVIFVRCFQLDCLSQFGPEYDVWTVDVAPPGVPLNPPRPPG